MADKQITNFTAKTQLTATDQFLLQEAGGVTKKCVATVLSDISYSGGGQIKFPATQNASSDANTLDDYEEGTFTPIIIGSTDAGTGTYSSQIGKYTKAGNVVKIVLAVTITNHTGTGSIYVGALPFASTVSGSPMASQITNLTYTGDYIVAVNISGDTKIFLYAISSGGGFAGVAIDTAFSITISGHYFVA